MITEPADLPGADGVRRDGDGPGGQRAARAAGLAVRRGRRCRRSSWPLGLNLMLAARESFLGLVPTLDSVRQVVYVIGNGAATLNAYAAPVSVNPTHTRALLMACGLAVLFAIDVLAFGVRRPPAGGAARAGDAQRPREHPQRGARTARVRGHRPAVHAAARRRARRQALVVGRLRRRRRGPGWPCCGRCPSSAVVVALVTAPFVPVTDLLNAHGAGVGNSTGGGGQFQLTTVNPFIRLRRDLVAQTHTPLVYARTAGQRHRLRADHRPRPVLRRRVAALPAQPAQRRTTPTGPSRTRPVSARACRRQHRTSGSSSSPPTSARPGCRCPTPCAVSR